MSRRAAMLLFKFSAKRELANFFPGIDKTMLIAIPKEREKSVSPIYIDDFGLNLNKIRALRTRL